MNFLFYISPIFLSAFIEHFITKSYGKLYNFAGLKVVEKSYSFLNTYSGEENYKFMENLKDIFVKKKLSFLIINNYQCVFYDTIFKTSSFLGGEGLHYGFIKLDLKNRQISIRINLFWHSILLLLCFIMVFSHNGLWKETWKFLCILPIILFIDYFIKILKFKKIVSTLKNHLLIYRLGVDPQA